MNFLKVISVLDDKKMPLYLQNKEYRKLVNSNEITITDSSGKCQEYTSSGQFRTMSRQTQHTPLSQARARVLATLELLKNDWKQLEKNELNFKNAVIGYSEFVSTNEKKRYRSKKQLKESENLEGIKDQGIEVLKKKCAKLQAIENEFSMQLTKHDIYKVYINNALKLSSFKEITELLTNYDILDANKHDIERHMNAIEDTFTRYAKLYDTIHESIFLEINSLNVKLCKDMMRYEKAHREVLKWEQINLDVYQLCRKKLINITEAVQAIITMYSRESGKSSTESLCQTYNIFKQIKYIDAIMKRKQNLVGTLQNKNQDFENIYSEMMNSKTRIVKETI